MLELFEKHKSFINYTVSQRRYYLKDEAEDCKQFILQALAMNYSKRYRYGSEEDWHRVVRAIISRKAIDYSKSRNVTRRGLVFESDWSNSQELTDKDPFLRKDNLGDCSTDPDCYKAAAVSDLLATMLRMPTKRRYCEIEKSFVIYVVSRLAAGDGDMLQIAKAFGRERAIEERASAQALNCEELNALVAKIQKDLREELKLQ